MARKEQIREMENILSQHNDWLRAADLAKEIRANVGGRLRTIGASFGKVSRNHPEKFSRCEPKKGHVFYAWTKNVQGKEFPEHLLNAKKGGKAGGGTSAKTKQTLNEEILGQMRAILPRYPAGVRYMELRSMIHNNLPNRSLTVIGSRLKFVANQNSGEISLKRKGKEAWYVWVGSSASVKSDQTDADSFVRTKRQESDFYGAFARLLERRSNKDAGDKTEYLEECSQAIVWGNKRAEGGKRKGDRKWANPDVIGIFKSVARMAIKFPDEVVSAEIKVDRDKLLTGFGQCCAYQLFSHKVYLVVPKVVAPKEEGENFKRLKTMCHLMGIGLVVFNPNDDPDPSIFTVILRARKQEPDAYFLNKSIPEDIIKKLYPEW